jgi:hypothetical protein
MGSMVHHNTNSRTSHENATIIASHRSTPPMILENSVARPNSISLLFNAICIFSQSLGTIIASRFARVANASATLLPSLAEVTMWGALILEA